MIALLTGLGAAARAQDAALSPPPAEPQVQLSRPALDLVGLAETGAAEDAQVTFINHSQDAFNLSADDIFYLRDQGITQAVLTAMLNHDKGVTTSPPAPIPASQAPETYNYNQQAYPPSIPLSNAPSLSDHSQSPPPYEPPAAPPVYDSGSAPPDVSYFYDSLQPYGTWMVVGGDWCWQPRAVLLDHTWRPYCHGGHWVYSSADWCWQSDYSWGWAPFHYGRWDLRPGVGWVWLPGREWGPGWVTWRTDGSYCGWAPLPWHTDFVAGAGFRFNGGWVGPDFGFGLGVNAFTFIGLGDFGAHDYFHRSIPPYQAQRFFGRTTVINNFQVNGDHIVRNTGIPLARVEAATHQTYRPLPIRDDPAGRGGAAIYRRPLAAPAVPRPFVAQKIDPQHPAVYHASIARPTALPRQTSNGYQGAQPAFRPNNNGGTQHTYASTPATTAPRYSTGAGARTYSPPAAQSAPSRYTSMNNVVQKQGTPVQNFAPAPASHVYYPKSYQQASETAPRSYGSGAAESRTSAPAVRGSTSNPAPAGSSHPGPPAQPHSGQNSQGR